MCIFVGIYWEKKYIFWWNSRFICIELCGDKCVIQGGLDVQGLRWISELLAVCEFIVTVCESSVVWNVRML